MFAVLCDEVDLLRRTAEETFYPALAMVGHGVPGGEDPVSKDGDEELLVGRTLPFLQEAANLCERLHTVSVNIVHQVRLLHAWTRPRPLTLRPAARVSLPRPPAAVPDHV